MKLLRTLLASVAALALYSMPALADEAPAAPATPAVQPAPAHAAPVQAAPAQAALAQAAPVQAAPAQAEPHHGGRGADLDRDALDPEVMKKLTGDQIVEVMRQRALIAAQDKNPKAEELVAIVVPITSFLFLFMGVASGLYFGLRKDRERHQTLRAMIERGGTISPELLVPPVKKYSDLRRGIILVTGGLGISIFIAATPADSGLWTAGLIPILIGAGYLIAWKLMRPGPQPVRDEAAIAAEQEVNNL